MDREVAVEEMAGELIQEVFGNADRIAKLHACLTSPRGDYFRLRLLQAMEVPLGEADIERLRTDSGMHEYHRHLNWLTGFGLVDAEEVEGARRYIRTGLAERAINAVREFERRLGKEEAKAV